MGGWRTTMFAEQRLPTLAELDAAVADRPVYLHMTGSGPSATNSLGKAFFETVTSPLAGPIAVGADGSIAAGAASNTALYHLRVRQTAADKERSAHDAMAYSVSTGLTGSSTRCYRPRPGRSIRDSRCPGSTTTACTTPSLRSTGAARCCSACRRTSCTTRTTSTCRS